MTEEVAVDVGVFTTVAAKNIMASLKVVIRMGEWLHFSLT